MAPDSTPHQYAPQEAHDLFNDFCLGASPDRFTKLLARYELFKLTVDLPGDIVECGVFKGAGLFYWARLLQIFNPLSTKRVIGFDLFDCEDCEATYEWDGRFLPDMGKEVSPAMLLDHARRQGLGSRVVLRHGPAQQTIPAFVKKEPGLRLSLLNLDFDNYDPTRAALEALYDRVTPGGVIVFDDYAIPSWGESQAVDEFFRGKGYTYRTFPWALSPKAYIVKDEITAPPAP